METKQQILSKLSDLSDRLDSNPFDGVANKDYWYYSNLLQEVLKNESLGSSSLSSTNGSDY